MAAGAFLASPLATAVYRQFFGNRSNKLLKLIPWTAIAALLAVRCSSQFYL